MKLIKSSLMLMVLMSVSVSMAQSKPGTQHREFNGRVYYYAPVAQCMSVGCAGSRNIATCHKACVPQQPCAYINNYYK